MSTHQTSHRFPSSPSSLAGKGCRQSDGTVAVVSSYLGLLEHGFADKKAGRVEGASVYEFASHGVNVQSVVLLPADFVCGGERRCTTSVPVHLSWLRHRKVFSEWAGKWRKDGSVRAALLSGPCPKPCAFPHTARPARSPRLRASTTSLSAKNVVFFGAGAGDGLARLGCVWRHGQEVAVPCLGLALRAGKMGCGWKVAAKLPQTLPLAPETPLPTRRYYGRVGSRLRQYWFVPGTKATLGDTPPLCERGGGGGVY